MTKNKWLSLNLLALACLTGFLKESPVDEMSSYLADVKVSIRPKATLDLGELPQEQEYKPLSYTGRLNPFELRGFVAPKSDETLTQEDAEKCPSGACGAAPDAHTRHFLEDYELMDLRMVGAIGRPGDSRITHAGKANGNFQALIRTPDAGIVLTRTGEYMGKNNGKIEDVGFIGMKLKETHQVSKGWQEKDEVITIFK